MAEHTRPWSAPQIIWSALIAIFVWSAFGFSWFGPGFQWTTKRGAEQMSELAVTDSLATICAAQARGAPNAASAIKELSGLSKWKRREYVEGEHWATMPGSEGPQNGVAELCASKLIDA